MENRSFDLSVFRQRIIRERSEKDWSQAEVAKKLTAMGIDNVHFSTVSKIETGDRDIKLDEAAAMAELYGVSLDALLGRKPESERDLRYLLDALTDAVFISRTELHRISKTIRDRLDDIPSDYERCGSLANLVGQFVTHLETATKALDGVVEESIKDIEQRAVEDLRRMSRQELGRLEKSIPPADKDTTE
jgi:transcriptional regulator with XRE-family HTH domain